MFLTCLAYIINTMYMLTGEDARNAIERGRKTTMFTHDSYIVIFNF